MLSIPDHAMFDETTKANIESWMSSDINEATKQEFERLLQEDPSHIVDAFYKRLSFGTGGLRGVMGLGTNRMNTFTVRSATQGLANYLIKTFPKEPIRLLIGYDSRNSSREFAEETAKVCAGNGIHAYLFEDLRPVPLVSFSCLEKKCHAAVMITASHNPPQYNGYKVYWADGAQVLPPHDQGIIDQVDQIKNSKQVKIAPFEDPLISTISDEMDLKYLEKIDTLQHYRVENQLHGSSLKIIYSALHGTGITLVPKTLAMWGFTNVSFVEKQIIPDGNFPTVSSPNPEDHAAMKMGVELLKQSEGDLLLATDPDADRVGVAFRHNNQVEYLDGNTIACLCLEHICQALTKQNAMPKKAAFIKTIVTSELFRTICDHYKVKCFDVLTGFKYIAQMINQWVSQPGSYQFIFGGEESYGYLLGTFSRDKDAIISCALISEVALKAKQEGKTLLDLRDEMYQKHGIYRSKLLSVNFEETREGREKMKKALDGLRESQPEMILGTPVLEIEDYLFGEKTHLESGKKEKITLPKSNVLRYKLHDGTVIALRPSGTEPKVKVYCGTTAKCSTNVQDAIEHCDVLCSDYIQTIQNTFLTSS